MPKDIVKIKGQYSINKRNRRIEKYQLYLLPRKNSRLLTAQKKRTRLSWFKLIGYYCLFYVCIIGCTLFYYHLLYKFRMPTTNPAASKWPGLSSAPGRAGHKRKYICYHEAIMQDIDPFIEQIDNFLEQFGLDGVTRLRECNLDSLWGYDSSEPCVLLKLNFAYNFTALTYDHAKTLPKEAPDDLYDYVLELAEENRINRIWMACTLKSKAKVKPTLVYVPERSYDADGLFEKQSIILHSISENLTEEEKVENPTIRRIIGVKFHNLPKNQDIYVRCTAWAKNIPIEIGTVDFVLHLKVKPKEQKSLKEDP